MNLLIVKRWTNGLREELPISFHMYILTYQPVAFLPLGFDAPTLHTRFATLSFRFSYFLFLFFIFDGGGGCKHITRFGQALTTLGPITVTL